MGGRKFRLSQRACKAGNTKSRIKIVQSMHREVIKQSQHNRETATAPSENEVLVNQPSVFHACHYSSTEENLKQHIQTTHACPCEAFPCDWCNEFDGNHSQLKLAQHHCKKRPTNAVRLAKIYGPQVFERITLKPNGQAKVTPVRISNILSAMNKRKRSGSRALTITLPPFAPLTKRMAELSGKASRVLTSKEQEVPEHLREENLWTVNGHDLNQGDSQCEKCKAWDLLQGLNGRMHIEQVYRVEERGDHGKEVVWSVLPPSKRRRTAAMIAPSHDLLLKSYQ